MRKAIIVFFILLTMFLMTSCGENENTTQSIADEVIINLPKDNTVNGYRKESFNSNNDSMPDIISTDDVTVGNVDSNTNNNSKDFCGNKNSKVFHKSNCGSVTSMSEHNKYYADRSTLISEGYKPCGKCKP